MIGTLTSRSVCAAGLACMVIVFAGISGCNSGPGGQDVMAKVNSYKILRTEVDKSYNSQVAGSPQKPTAAEEEALRLQILEHLIDLQIHLQQADKLGVMATDDEVESKFNQLKAPYTQEEFQKRLKDQNLTDADLKQDIRRNLTIEKLLNKEIASKVTISDSDITNYYNQHKPDFNLIEPRYHVSQIQVLVGQPAQPGAKAQTDAEAKQKIQMIYNRLESGEDFAQLAGQWSDDPETAHNGGDLGTIPESALKSTDAPTREAIQKLKPGQYSQVISVINPANRQLVGYRIVKLINKELAGQRDLNDPAVQQWIRTQLRTQREQLLRAAYDEVLRNKADVHNYYAEQIMKTNANQK
ncbi:MAG TPA: SurA N-terminal domain-containing protein [Candidatus Limnocylindrales bacterium]|nr:SurA N-terminal domain-containing protein [Candidatus Limnocylindrales bacterium]